MICYTDGACHQNSKSSGPGGYSVIILDDNENFIDCYQHFEENTTNNKQEMKAILWALLHCGKHQPLIVYSDSAYAINTFSSWMFNWARNGWVKSDKKIPENLDLVQAFYDLVVNQGYNVEFVKISGHTGIYWNEIADKLAAGNLGCEEVRKQWII